MSTTCVVSSRHCLGRAYVRRSGAKGQQRCHERVTSCAQLGSCGWSCSGNLEVLRNSRDQMPESEKLAGMQHIRVGLKLILRDDSDNLQVESDTSHAFERVSSRVPYGRSSTPTSGTRGSHRLRSNRSSGLKPADWGAGESGNVFPNGSHAS
jgi:hypothetical protein